MCGIAGIIAKNPDIVSPQNLQRMTAALAHRGPDGESHWVDETGLAALGHRRLSIIDLSANGQQPMHYRNRYSIVHNGEVYNYIELRQNLAAKGYTFQSQTDTEVMMAAYDCYGADCMQHFDGMFAFAIWDRQEQQLFAARDRFGEKPFYYFFNESTGSFYFASEMKALFAAGVPKQVHSTMLLNYLALGYVQNPADSSITFFENVFALPPAHSLTYHARQCQLQWQTYWDLDKITQSTITEPAAIEQFRSLFLKSIQHRLRSDVPIGTSLSGGLDSSGIVAGLQQLGKAGSMQTFSAVFPGFEKDESQHIRQVNERFGLSANVVEPQGDIDTLKKIMVHQEEPVASASVLAQWKVYEMARQKGVTVLLDGQGADETLAGYAKYIHWALQEQLAAGEWSAAKKAATAFQQNGWQFPWSWKNYVAAFLPSLTAHKLENKAWKNIKASKYLNPDFVATHASRWFVHKPMVEKLNDQLYADTMGFGLGTLLRYADRNSMAHGVEVRLPFLQQELVQFIFSLPATYKMNNGFSKLLLRKTLEGQLPDSIVWRKDKVGFEPPQAQWMQRQDMQELLMHSKQQLLAKGIISQRYSKAAPTPQSAYAPENIDWYCLSAGLWLEI